MAKIGEEPEAGQLKRVDYLYQMNDSFDSQLGGWWPNYKDTCSTMCEFKEAQLKGGDSDNGNKPYEISTFPVISCFHHAKKRDNYNSTNMYAPVLQISYAGNFFFSRVRWEEGVWTP